MIHVDASADRQGMLFAADEGSHRIWEWPIRMTQIIELRRP
jgi:hypothetical protein